MHVICNHIFSFIGSFPDLADSFCQKSQQMQLCSCLVIVLKLYFGHCWGLRERGQSSQGARKEEGVKRRKVKKKKKEKLTFERKTAGGVQKPGS